MSTFHDYESMASLRFDNRQCPLVEAYRGTDIVDWHGRIEQSLNNLLNDAEKANNYTFANRLRTFLKTWKDNPIDGSLNRETIMLLASAADQWSADPWDLQTYFLSLRTSLNKLVASEEELPRDVDMNQNEPPMGGGGGHGGGGGGPPMSPAFGPEKEEPGAGATEMGGEPGAAGAPGEELGLGGEEGGVEPGEAEGEGLGGPEPEEEPKPRLARL